MKPGGHYGLEFSSCHLLAKLLFKVCRLKPCVSECHPVEPDLKHAISFKCGNVKYDLLYLLVCNCKAKPLCLLPYKRLVYELVEHLLFKVHLLEDGLWQASAVHAPQALHGKIVSLLVILNQNLLTVYLGHNVKPLGPERSNTPKDKNYYDSPQYKLHKPGSGIFPDYLKHLIKVSPLSNIRASNKQ